MSFASHGILTQKLYIYNYNNIYIYKSMQKTILAGIELNI